MSTVPADLDQARVELNRRCDAIEECYEFMLAYAGQGLESDVLLNAGPMSHGSGGLPSWWTLSRALSMQDAAVLLILRALFIVLVFHFS